MENKLKVIITGSTGMVGEGVTKVCIDDPKISQILLINRRKSGFEHQKIKEIVIADLVNLSLFEDELCGYDACLYCLGVSSVGMNKSNYYKITYELTLNIAKLLSRFNKNMTFIYVSGAGTDSTEKRIGSWSAVKGKTENDLMKLPFKKVYGYRPGFLKPMKGTKYSHNYYKYINWIFPIGKRIMPDYFNTLEDLGKSMINILIYDFIKTIVKGKDIKLLAEQK
jgi:hypothetical protein